MILNMSEENVMGELSHETSARDHVDYGEPPQLRKNLPKLSELNEASIPWESVKLPTDVLLATVKDWEFLSCYYFLRNPHESHCRGLGFVHFGDMGDAKHKLNVCLLRCFEGATGPGAALSKVSTAIRLLQPKAVFCVGFCGGLSYEKVKLGDVVISKKIITYAHKKVMNDREQPRGYVAPVSSDMADLIRHAANGWKPPILQPEVNREPVVHCDAVILSGPELVNCGWRREELLDKHSEAIAIEMEGEGIFAAAYDLKMEWVVVKGVSDYADGNKSKTEAWQPFASVMAASVVENMLKFPGVLKDWQHYKGMNHSQSGGKWDTPTVLMAFVVLLIAIGIMYFSFIGRLMESVVLLIALGLMCFICLFLLPNRHQGKWDTPTVLWMVFVVLLIMNAFMGFSFFIGLLTGLVVVLLIILENIKFYHSPLPPEEHVGAKGFDTHQGSGPQHEDPKATLFHSIPGGQSGQVNYKDGTISFMAKGLVHSLFEPFVYAATAYGIKGSGPQHEDPKATLFQSITGGQSGQVNYKDRTIIYGAKGRVHSLNELWVYDGTAWDIESGITAKVKHYKQSEDAVKDAVSEVMKKLREQEIIKD